MIAVGSPTPRAVPSAILSRIESPPLTLLGQTSVLLVIEPPLSQISWLPLAELPPLWAVAVGLLAPLPPGAAEFGPAPPAFVGVATAITWQ